jgi:MFS family permease
MDSVFERIQEQDVSRWVNGLALAVLIAGVLGGVIVSRFRKPAPRYLILGALSGLAGPAVALVWHVVDARTSYWDYVHRDLNPGKDRLLWPVVGAGRLDSVSHLAGLAAGLLLVGVVAGTGCGLMVRWLNRRFPAARRRGGAHSPAAAPGIHAEPAGDAPASERLT